MHFHSHLPPPPPVVLFCSVVATREAGMEDVGAGMVQVSTVDIVFDATDLVAAMTL